MLSRKHFKMIAKIIDRSSHYLDDEGKDMLAEDFANSLMGENERFDRSRFMEACGVE